MSALLQDLDADGEDGLDGRPFAEINVTPFVDVMLVLLVVFMMAAPLLVRGVPVDLPRNAGRALGHLATPLIVTLSRDGSLFLREDKLTPMEFDDRLRALRNADPVVYVRADRGVAYGAVMDVIGHLSAAGFSHVSLLSQPRTAGAE